MRPPRERIYDRQSSLAGCARALGGADEDRHREDTLAHSWYPCMMVSAEPCARAKIRRAGFPICAAVILGTGQRALPTIVESDVPGARVCLERRVAEPIGSNAEAWSMQKAGRKYTH